jgi:hypothetical protein
MARTKSTIFVVTISTDVEYNDLYNRLFACGEQYSDWNIVKRGEKLYHVTTKMVETAKEAFLHSGVQYRQVEA